MAATLFEELYGLLSPTERTSFFEFIETEIISAPPKLKALSRFVVSYLNRTEAQNDDGENQNGLTIFLVNKGFKPSYARNLLSDLTWKLRWYMTKIENPPESPQGRIEFLRHLLRRNVPFEVFERFWRQTDKTLRKINSPSLRGMYQHMEMKRLLYEAGSLVQDRRKKNPKGQSPTRDSLGEAIIALDQYYLIQRGLWQLEWELQKEISVSDLKLPPSPVVLDDSYIASWQGAANFLGTLFSYAKELLEKGSGYSEMKAFLLAHPPNREEHLRFCLHLQSYCIRQYNQTQEPEYLSEYLAWMNHRHKNGILLHQNKLSHPEFKNFITCCLKLKPPSTARAMAFLDKFAPVLEPTFKEEVIHFNRANIYFHEEAYRKSLRVLKASTFTDPYTKLDARTLILKNLYCIGDHESLETEIHNLSTQLYRTRNLPQATVIAVRKKVQYLEKIIHTLSKQKAKLRKIRQELLDEERVSDRHWLLDQLDAKLRN